MATSLPSFVEPLGDGIFAIDTGFHRDRFDAAYLVVESGRAAFIDTGTAFAVPRLLAALESAGLGPAAVDYVIATHVHLDHAGGVGQLMQALPGARAVVHPRGARHLVDPSALYQGALMVYGQARMDSAYGTLEPVSAARILATRDDDVVELAGRPLRFAHTPGHALHHHCIWDERSRGWFTGDTFGMAYPEFIVDGRHFIFPTTTPVQFDPATLAASIDRLLANAPRQMFVTHYGRVTGVADCGARLKTGIADMMRILDESHGAGDRLAALEGRLMSLYAQGARDFGVTLPDAEIEALLKDDVQLNAAGMMSYVLRTHRPSPAT